MLVRILGNRVRRSSSQPLITYLDPGSAIANNGHALAFHVYTLYRPEGGMTHIALIIFNTRPVWEVTFGCESKAAVHESRRYVGFIVTFNLPGMIGLVPCGGLDSGVVYGVLTNVEHLVHVLEVSL